MKEISLPITQTFSMTIDTHNIDMSKTVDLGDGRIGVHVGTMSSIEVAPIMEVARKNGGHILYAATSIEQQLEGILMLYFMGPFIKHDDRRQVFEMEILQSSSMSYSAKKELVLKIVSDNNLLDGEVKNQLQTQLKKIMEWRNAFAHGKMQYDNIAGCFIKHYSGRQQKLDLNDGYWEKVEQNFKECNASLKEVLDKLVCRAQ
ncbi:MAG: hypothetical protein WC825_05380 [Gallionellaceae bacterium]|jgi:hypothetical protein